MEDVRREVAALRGRLRLQMLLLAGLIAGLVLSAGGADVVARALVESDAWKIRTKKADLTTVVDRLVVTTDVDNARVKILNANLELAKQPTLPTTGVVEGLLGYDSTNHLLKFYNGTAWVSSGAGGGGGAATLGKGFVGGRLTGAGNTLFYSPWVNNIIEVNNEYVVIAGAGMSMLTSTTLIDSAGNNSSATMQDGVTYYAYISNSLVTWAPNSLRCSATGVLQGYLGTTGTAANWRCVGMIRLAFGQQLQDNETMRWIYNSYNRTPKRLFTCPGFVDDGATTTWNNSSTVWFGVGPPNTSRLSFLVDFNTQIVLHANITVKISGGDCWLGIGDGNQSAWVQTVVQQGVYTNVTLTHHPSLNIFDHSMYCDLQMRVTGGTATMLVDSPRVTPLVPDSKVTFFYGTIWN